jgi:hypothetical protein
MVLFRARIKYILVEMGNYFDTVLKPRIMKVTYSMQWRDGKPTSRDTGVSHMLKYVTLEQCEDTLNNIDFTNRKEGRSRARDNPDVIVYWPSWSREPRWDATVMRPSSWTLGMPEKARPR